MNREICSLVDSIRGNPKLVARGYLFIKDKCEKGNYYWNCELKVSRSCKGRAVTVLENEVHLLKKFKDHNHAPEASRSEVIQTLNTIKEKAYSGHDQPVQIIQNVITDMPQDSSYYMPNKESLRKQIHRVRSENMPTQPRSLQEIDIPMHLRKTMNGDRFLARNIDVDDEKMLIFCTQSNLQHLQDAEYWIMDGTFKSVPTLFHQLYTIHAPVGGEDNSSIFPMVYILMTARTEEMYTILFEELIELGEQAEAVLSPPIIITDFEQAVINAVKSEFPNSIHKGCFFHLCQNFWRKIQSEGFAREYGTNEDFSIKLRHVTALAFLPPSEIQAAFDQVKLLLPEDAAGITDYFEKNYIRGRARNLKNRSHRTAPLFSPEFWSVNHLVDLGYPRTQNIVESWHNRWINLLGKAHVGVYTIIEEMRKEQQQTKINIENIIRGAPRPSQRNQYINRETRILSIFNDRNNRTLMEFLRGIAHNISF